MVNFIDSSAVDCWLDYNIGIIITRE